MTKNLIKQLNYLNFRLEEVPCINKLLIKEDRWGNPVPFKYIKGFAVEVADEVICNGIKNLEIYISNAVVPKIILTKYLILNVEKERNILKSCWIISFILLDVCAAIRDNQKLSKNTLKKAESYVMETNDSELLFKYKTAILCRI